MESYHIFIITAVFNLGAFIGVARYLIKRLATKDEVRVMLAKLEQRLIERIHEIDTRVAKLEK